MTGALTKPDAERKIIADTPASPAAPRFARARAAATSFDSATPPTPSVLWYAKFRTRYSATTVSIPAVTASGKRLRAAFTAAARVLRLWEAPHPRKTRG